MNRMLALLGCVFATAASANSITLNFDALTDGNRYSYHGYGEESPEYVAEYIGAMQLYESLSFNWDVTSVDGPLVSDLGTRTIHSLTTRFTPSDMQVSAGLLSPGLTPSFVATSGDSYAEVSGYGQWIDFVDPARADRGSIQFDLTFTWAAFGQDPDGTSHAFNYSRGYSFYNNSLLTSVNDLTVFNEALFQQLLSSPTTRMWFGEGVSEWSSHCDVDGNCAAGENWGYVLEGTFDVSVARGVPEPESLAIIGIGCLLLGLSLRRRNRAS